MPAPTDRLLSAGYRRLARPVLFRLDAERSHHGTVRALELLGGSAAGRAVLGGRTGPPAGDPVELAGLRFPNRVGLAAGVDKDGRALTAWPVLGFGHVELGTVTARPQPGNPGPRMFRLAASEAVINRMGFNNAGAAALAERLRAASPVPGLVVGVSIGKSRVVPVAEATEDYLAAARALDGLADYLAVNVSSPNTPGLRALQDRGPLEELLGALTGELAVRARAHGGSPPPVLVKIAPDLTEAALEEVLEVALATGVQGLVATNTTLARDGLAAADLPLAQEAGGLSGAPLARRARQVVGFLAGRGPLPVIGAGGVMSLADGRALLDAGARLVQVYTGLVYRGPQLVRELAEGLGERVER